MAQAGVLEARVAGEKRGIVLLTQQDDDLLVLQTFAAKVNSNLLRASNSIPVQRSAVSIHDLR
jgi:hypothetical protein